MTTTSTSASPDDTWNNPPSDLATRHLADHAANVAIVRVDVLARITDLAYDCMPDDPAVAHACSLVKALTWPTFDRHGRWGGGPDAA